MNLNNCKYNFSTDSIYIFKLVYDASGSMDKDVNDIREANCNFKEDFSKFEGKNSVVISRSVFNNYTYSTEFLGIEDFKTDYYAKGGTELYRAIVQTVEETIDYYNEVIKRTNITPHITYIVLSDGGDNEYHDKNLSNDAKKAVEKIKELGGNCIFVAFREAVKLKDGQRLGFGSTENIKNRAMLKRLLGEELSKGVKEQSKSNYSLGSTFFSKAGVSENNNESEEFDEDDFFNNLT